MKKPIGERGIFLSEAVFSVFILTLVILIAFPILLHTYQERRILQQKGEAIGVLRDQLMRWKTGDQTFPAPNTAAGFTLHWVRKTDHEASLCVRWSYGGRNHELRSEARK